MPVDPSERIVIIGGSKGGIKAVETILAGIASPFPHPVVLVLHRISYKEDRLIKIIQHDCLIPVTEPDDKDPVLSGRLYLAPADYHLMIEDGWFHLSIDEPVQHNRPSIDMLFASAANDYGSGVTAILLTGANADGTQGLKAVKRKNGTTLVQDPKTAEAPEMPRSAIAAGVADQVLSLESIAEYLAGFQKTYTVHR
jgi:two-component system chemotaxis response regulator CheB